MTLNTQAIVDAAQSHAMASGWFERVNGHEPKNAPGSGLSAAVWVQELRPSLRRSGLNRTSAVLTLNVRVYTSMLSEPQDAIDPTVMNAVDALMAAYSGDFNLGDADRTVDLLGSEGVPLSALAGYDQIDGKVYRIVTITLPVIVNDSWEQVA